MKTRIHFAVGPTAMYFDLELADMGFVDFMDKVQSLRKMDEVLLISEGEKNVCIAARSVVVVEEVPS